MNTAISVRLPKELLRHLERLAKETERSKSFMIQKAIELYLDNYADLQVALDRLHNSTDPIISSKDMRKSLGL